MGCFCRLRTSRLSRNEVTAMTSEGERDLTHRSKKIETSSAIDHNPAFLYTQGLDVSVNLLSCARFVLKCAPIGGGRGAASRPRQPIRNRNSAQCILRSIYAQLCAVFGTLNGGLATNTWFEPKMGAVNCARSELCYFRFCATSFPENSQRSWKSPTPLLQIFDQNWPCVTLEEDLWGSSYVH